MTKLLELAAKALKSMARGHFDLGLLVAGVVFLLLGSINGVDTSNGYKIVLFTPPATGLLILGGSMILIGIGVNVAGRWHSSAPMPPELNDLLTTSPAPSAPHQLQPASIPHLLQPMSSQSGMADPGRQLEAQRLRLESRIIPHPLTSRIQKGLPSVTDWHAYKSELQERYAQLSDTNKKIVYYLYRQFLQREVAVDDLLELFNEWFDGDPVPSATEFLHRILLIASAGLFTVTSVGGRRTEICKVATVGDALEGSLS